MLPAQANSRKLRLQPDSNKCPIQHWPPYIQGATLLTVSEHSHKHCVLITRVVGGARRAHCDGLMARHMIDAAS
jgi:hypothetical protein